MDRTQSQAAAGEMRPVTRIVVPVAGTDREFIVQEHAVFMAGALEVPILAVHVTSPTEPANGHLFEWITKTCKEWNVELETHALDGDDTADVLVEELEPMDLVIIGSERMGGRYHFGSVAERVVAQAPCPVQIIRLDD